MIVRKHLLYNGENTIRANRFDPIAIAFIGNDLWLWNLEDHQPDQYECRSRVLVVPDDNEFEGFTIRSYIGSAVIPNSCPPCAVHVFGGGAVR